MTPSLAASDINSFWDLMHSHMIVTVQPVTVNPVPEFDCCLTISDNHVIRFYENYTYNGETIPMYYGTEFTISNTTISNVGDISIKLSTSNEVVGLHEDIIKFQSKAMRNYFVEMIGQLADL